MLCFLKHSKQSDVEFLSGFVAHFDFCCIPHDLIHDNFRRNATQLHRVFQVFLDVGNEPIHDVGSQLPRVVKVILRARLEIVNDAMQCRFQRSGFDLVFRLLLPLYFQNRLLSGVPVRRICSVTCSKYSVPIIGSSRLPEQTCLSRCRTHQRDMQK